MNFGNFTREDSVTSGTGTLTLTQVTGFARLSDIFANGITVSYSIKNGNNREVGLGTVGAANTLARTSIEATLVAGVYDDTSPSAITLSGSSEVYVVVTAADLQGFDDHVNSASNPHNTSINNATDTVLSTLANGHNLIHNGSEWVNNPKLYFVDDLYRQGATLNGTVTTGHVNLGSGTSVTGTAATTKNFCTIGGGEDNSATQEYATVGGGKSCVASGAYAAVPGGLSCVASGQYALASGQSNTASGIYSVSLGFNNTASGAKTMVFGEAHNVTGSYSTAIGSFTCTAAGFASGNFSAARSTASGDYAVVLGGRGSEAAHNRTAVMGGGGKTRADYDVIIGATVTDTPSVTNNTIRFQGTGGNIKIDGAVSSPEADIAEMFEWLDGNVNDIDRVGFFVSLDKGKIVIGGDNIIGIISGTPSLISNDAPNNWVGTYIKDRHKRNKKDKYTRIEWIEKINGVDEPIVVYESQDKTLYDEYPQPTSKGGIRSNKIPKGILKKEVVEVNIVNPLFDISLVDSYVPRSQRKEWGVVGVNGQIIVNTSELITDWKVSVDKATGMAKNARGNATGTYDVIEVIDSATALVYFK